MHYGQSYPGFNPYGWMFSGQMKERAGVEQNIKTKKQFYIKSFECLTCSTQPRQLF